MELLKITAGIFIAIIHLAFLIENKKSSVRWINYAIIGTGLLVACLAA